MCQDTSDLGNRDTQQHVMSCLGYEKFRKDKDLSIDKDIVQYFKEIIQNREDNEFQLSRLASDRGAAGLSW